MLVIACLGGGRSGKGSCGVALVRTQHPPLSVGVGGESCHMTAHMRIGAGSRTGWESSHHPC